MTGESKVPPNTIYCIGYQGKPLFEKWSVQMGTTQITSLKQEIDKLDDKEVPQIIR